MSDYIELILEGMASFTSIITGGMADYTTIIVDAISFNTWITFAMFVITWLMLGAILYDKK